MSGLIFLHVFALGIWSGCVAVEMVIELTAWRAAELRPALARFHDRIDRIVEIPILIVILATGVALLMRVPWTGLLLLKVGLALVAIGANAWCVIPVVRRGAVADSGDDALLMRYSRQVMIAFLIGFPCALAALAIGLRSGGIW